MGRAMQDIAQGEGDLTKRLKVTSNDEFGTLANAFNRFVERIHESIREVAGTARQLHDVAQLVVNASNSSMANSDEQSNRTNSVAAAINELGAAAQEIARNAADASHHASDANHQAEDGKQVVEQTIRAMNELSEKISASCANIEALNSRTVNIGQILEVIKGISEQTNLLALNAAIEAARAGDLEDDGSFRSIRDWPRAWRQFLSGIEIAELFEGRGDDRRIAGVLRKVKWPDKLRNLELLSRHVGTESAALDLELKRLDVAKKRAELKLLENPEEEAPPTSVAVTIIDARVRDADAE